jgi:hypothetical protein
MIFDSLSRRSLILMPLLFLPLFTVAQQRKVTILVADEIIPIVEGKARVYSGDKVTIIVEYTSVNDYTSNTDRFAVGDDCDNTNKQNRASQVQRQMQTQ